MYEAASHLGVHKVMDPMDTRSLILKDLEAL
jgi:hypothetical protein